MYRRLYVYTKYIYTKSTHINIHIVVKWHLSRGISAQDTLFFLFPWFFPLLFLGKMTFEPRGITAQDTVVFVIGTELLALLVQKYLLYWYKSTAQDTGVCDRHAPPPRRWTKADVRALTKPLASSVLWHLLQFICEKADVRAPPQPLASSALRRHAPPRRWTKADVRALTKPLTSSASSAACSPSSLPVYLLYWYKSTCFTGTKVLALLVQEYCGV
jgi:hypothetical protein